MTNLAQLHIKGAGATAGTTALLVENTDGDDLLTVDDAGGVSIIQTPTSGSSSNDIVVRDSATGILELRDASSIGSSVSELNDLTDVTTGLPASIGEADDGKMLFLDATLSAFTTDDAVTHGTVIINGKKASAGTIAKGTPVYLVGFDSDLHTVEAANASTATTMPVIGFAAEELDATNSKHIMTFGKLSGVVTSGYTVGDDLYMDTTTGQLTTTRPTGAVEIQRVATVLKVDAVNGQILIYNTARTAGLPNLQDKHIWIGDSNGQPVQEITRDQYISDMTTVNLLDDVANWDVNANYTGTAITDTYQGQKHYNSSYFFECVHDNVWIRMVRQ